MFNIFSKIKPRLFEIIPSDFVDIHSHILPGIDDGAKSLEESLRLLDQIEELGFSKIYGTPHTYPGLYDNTNETIRNSFETLKKSYNNSINIEFASEYMLDESLIKKANDKTLLTIKDNFILVEMSFISAPNDLFEIIFNIQLNGYKPIIAHPERYRFYFNDISNLYKLKDIGCYFQINLLSLTGHYGRDISRFSDKLLKENLIDFAGSDFHSTNHIIQIDNLIKINEVEKVKQVFLNNELFY